VILPQILYKISKELNHYDAKAIIVGGVVRDYFLKQTIKDYDIEIYGLNHLEELEEILKKFGTVNLVGKSFGILKFNFNKEEFDFSFPRLESKISKGHCGFDVVCDGALSFEEASKRRDFTINSMGYQIESKKFLDPFGGIDDIKKKSLRVVDSRTFIEDPLRVYRAIQFCARFEFMLSTDTKLICVDMINNNLLDELPKERVFCELEKLMLKSNKPSIGFNLMRELGVLKYFEELERLNLDDWQEVMASIDSVAIKKETLDIMFASLVYKLNILDATSLLYRLTDNHKFIKSVVNLSYHYNIPKEFFMNKARDRDIRELATKVNISKLIKLVDDKRVEEWLLNSAKRLGVESRPLEAILSGKDLIALGLKPSPKFKEILAYVYKLQLNGEIKTKEEACRVVRDNEKCK